MIIEFPFLYNSEVIMPKCRKKTMIQIMDTLPIEVETIEGELPHVVAMNIKRQWNSMEGETNRKLLSYIIEHDNRLMSPVSRTRGMNKIPEQIADNTLLHLIPETTVMKGFELNVRETVSLSDLREGIEAILKNTEEGGLLYGHDMTRHLALKGSGHPIYTTHPDVRETISNDRDAVIKQLMETMNNRYVSINGILYRDAKMPIYTMEPGQFRYMKSGYQQYEFNSSRNLSWTAWKNNNLHLLPLISIPLPFFSVTDDMKDWNMDDIKIKKTKEKNGDTYIMDMDALIRHVSMQDIYDQIMKIMPAKEILFKNESGNIEPISQCPGMPEHIRTHDEMAIYTHLMQENFANMYNLSPYDISETQYEYNKDKPYQEHISFFHTEALSSRIKLMNIIATIAEHIHKTPENDLNTVMLQAEYKPNPGYRKFMESRNRSRFYY